MRVLEHDEVHANAVRGQYGVGKMPDGENNPAYRKEHMVDPESNTETFAAVKMHIDN